MKLDKAIDDLSHLARSLDFIEDFSIRIELEDVKTSVQPLGYGVHSAQNALTSLATANNIATVTEVFFRRFEG